MDDFNLNRCLLNKSLLFFLKNGNIIIKKTNSIYFNYEEMSQYSNFSHENQYANADDKCTLNYEFISFIRFRWF